MKAGLSFTKNVLLLLAISVLLKIGLITATSESRTYYPRSHYLGTKKLIFSIEEMIDTMKMKQLKTK